MWRFPDFVEIVVLLADNFFGVVDGRRTFVEALDDLIQLIFVADSGVLDHLIFVEFFRAVEAIDFMEKRA